MIAFDRREGSAYLAQLLPPGMSMVTTLPYGDACWYGVGPAGETVRVGVECKRVGDLLQCLHDGRFVGHQLPGMLAAYQYTYLLVEGVTRPNPNTGDLQVWRPWRDGDGGRWEGVRVRITYEAWEQHLETLRRKTPLEIVHSTGPDHTAKLILTLYKWWCHNGGWDRHQSHMGVHIPPDVFVANVTLPVYRRLVMKVAQQLPGVRDVLAERVMAAFDTVRDMVNAGVEEWEKVEGIGAVKAVQIVSAIHGPKAHQPQPHVQSPPQPAAPVPLPGNMFPQLGDLQSTKRKPRVNSKLTPTPTPTPTPTTNK